MGFKFAISLFLIVISVSGFPNPKEDRGGSSLEWQILTKKNFSSQIRNHPHVILMVTVPWSGESRSLMKEIVHQADYKQEKLNHLRLMVVYRNEEKMLADVLGATEGIAIICYHHSAAYKYRGRLRALNILSSADHLMSLQSEDLPLKTLKSPEDLKAFVHSTDKAVLLLEFCGWTARLLHKNKHDGKESALHLKPAFNNDSVSAENVNGEADSKLPFHKKETQKTEGFKDENMVCGVETGISGIPPWLSEFTWTSENASLGVENRGDMGLSCSYEEFQQFESFFTKFETIARDYFLPPERQRFGLVSNRSLLSFLGVGEPDRWLLMLQFLGCHNCTKILNEGDDLKNAMLLHHPLLLELEGEGDNHEPVLPANRPSIVLFVDRSSESLNIRRMSKSALEDFRELAMHNQLSGQMRRDQDSSDSEDISAQNYPGMESKGITDPSGPATVKLSPAPVMVKFKDDMAYMIVDQGGSFSLDNMAGDAQGILSYLLQQKNPAFHVKEEKISILAKEVGFHLLSDDFVVKLVDALPLPEGNGQSKAPEHQISELPVKSLVENRVTLNEDNLLSSITAVEQVEQSELVELETSVQNKQEAITQSEGNAPPTISETAEEFKKGEYDSVESKDVGKSDHCSKEMEVGTLAPHSQQPFQLEQGPSDIQSSEEHNYRSRELHGEDGLSGMPSEQNCNGDCLDPALAGRVPKADGLITSDKLEEHQAERRSFGGSFFFSDGGYRLLRSLTANSKIPSVVIVDPVLQQHYVFPDENVFSHSSLVQFVDGYLNGSLPPYQRSQRVLMSPRETPQPPFVNLDFREADSVPRVTANMFSELVLGVDPCDGGYTLACSNTKNVGPAWKKDVLVLFSNTWCAFCQRMELVVREVYRAFKGYMNALKSESNRRKTTFVQDSVEDVLLEFPLIFFMDCTLNDCSALLKSMGQRELYPALVLFPAEKKDAVRYRGDILVASIIEFIVAHGSNSHHLSGSKGILWTRTQKGGGNNELHNAHSSAIPVTTVVEGESHEVLLNSMQNQANKHNSVGLPASDGFQEGGHQLGIGSVLIATDKLINASPFDKSKILVVKADQNDGFQGLIINKRISWDVFPDLEEDLASLKHAPLSFGGPVVAPGMPLVSFTRRASEVGFVEIFPNFYYGNPLATNQVIEEIRSGNHSAIDYWFFLGYSGWGWDQLFAELAEGSWQVNSFRLEQIHWPDS